ncbi:MAG: hypothetical protein GXX10_03305 [Clostridiaceae bacterium]|nr:hypothetical protein [Clostridiaceae bacterium]
MIFAGCTSLGLSLSNRLAARQRALAKLIEILVNLKSQICGLGIPLSTAFENIGRMQAEGVWAHVFLTCSKNMKEERIDAGEAWKKALIQNKDMLPLEESDFDVLMDLGEMLGKSDRHNQESVLDLEKEKLATLATKAKEALETKGKLYRNMGALTGAAMVILLI